MREIFVLHGTLIPLYIQTQLPFYRIVKKKCSSKEMGFFNPRSHLDSTVVTYCPHAAKKGEWEREGAILGEGRGKNADPSRVYIVGLKKPISLLLVLYIKKMYKEGWVECMSSLLWY